MHLKQRCIQFGIGICALCLLTSQSQADYISGPPQWSASIQTTGGITYFVHSSTLDVCFSNDGYLQGRTDNTLNLYAAETQGEICPDCFGCTYEENGAIVLGALSPGDYTLMEWTPKFRSPNPPYQLNHVYTFQVPGALENTLVCAPGTNANQMVVKVTGHPWANYRLESSPDLKTWGPVASAFGAPCAFNVTLAPPQKFFRVKILDGTTGQ